VLVDFDRGTGELMTVVKVGKEEPADKPALARKPWPAAASQVLTRDLAESLGMKGKTGVRVTEVYTGMAAAKAGLEVGDIILAVDGIKVEASQPSDADVYDTMIRKYDVGAEAVLTVIRGKEQKKITMTLDAPPTPSDRLAKYEDQDFECTVRDLSVMDRIQKKEDQSLRGVLVERTEPGGWAAFGGLSGGDVVISIDSVATPDVAQVEKILKAAKQSKPRRIVFFVKRGIHTMYVEIEPDWRYVNH
jgi:S1-C subfamily serine protease